MRWLVWAVVAGCFQDPTGTRIDRVPAPIVDVLVDANRDGVVELDSSDDEDEKWNAARGAIVLANLDDDDEKGAIDASDSIVNGLRDLEDLSPIVLRPIAGATQNGRLSLDAKSIPKVNLFRVLGSEDDPTSYALVADPSQVVLTPAELRVGVRFAIEARELVSSTAADAWTGIIEATLEILDATGEVAQKDGAPMRDTARLRVAPLLLQYNTAKTQAVYYADLGRDTQSLVDGVIPGVAPLDPIGLAVDEQWAQDFFDIGYTFRPGRDGGTVSMKIAIRSAQPDRSAGDITRKYFLGPNFGYVFKYDPETASIKGHGHSMSSFGNWDVIPPYDKGDQHFPLGRNLWGAVPNSEEQPDLVFQDFIRAQRVQPEINLDTSWLTVGHVDEFTSWVKTTTPRGWGMLVASPRLARQMLLDLQAAGHGAVQMFVGRNDFFGRSSAVSIDQVLASPALMSANQLAQQRIDDAVVLLQQEIGLGDDEITEIPFLFEHTGGGALAYQPGTVNLLHVDGKVVIPDPFGPIIDGKDPFKSDLEKRLGVLGLDVHFADDWYTFHLSDGEVHCGTNVSRDLSTVAWWR